MRGHVSPWLLRRVLLLVSAALVVAAVVLFFSVQVAETSQGQVETINGQANTNGLALPLALFVIGLAGLLAALGWHPRRE